MEDKREQKSVIVISDDSSEKKPWAVSWPSFSFYFKKFKYWILGATLLCGILGFAILNFVYNPSRSVFKVGFAYQKSNFVASTDSRGNTTYSYSNGFPFDYQSIVSVNTMRSVVQAADTVAQNAYRQNNPSATEEQIATVRGEFSSIDYQKIADENLLTIAPITDSAVVDTNAYLAYDISGYTADFQNVTLARRFILALIQTGQTGFTTSIDNFRADTALDGFNEISSPYERFDNQIAMLQRELDFLFGSYTSLLNIFNSDSSLSTSASESRNLLNTSFNAFKNTMGMSIGATATTFSNISSLQASMTFIQQGSTQTIVYIDPSIPQQTYQNYFTNKAMAYTTQLEELNLELAAEKKAYADLQALSSQAATSEERDMLALQMQTISSRINTLNLQISDYTTLQNKINYQKNFIASITTWETWETTTSQNYQNVAEGITSEYQTLLREANTFKDVYAAIFQDISAENGSSVKTLYRDLMAVSGEIAWYWGVAIGALLGFAISCTASMLKGQAERREAILTGERDPILPAPKTILPASSAPFKR